MVGIDVRRYHNRQFRPFAGLPYKTGVALARELKGLVPEGLTLAQMSLRWLLDQQAVRSVITGASGPDQMADTAAVSQLPSLDNELQAQLSHVYHDKVLAHIRGRDLMHYRRLGKTELKVSDIGFGAWQLGNHDQWGGMDDNTAHHLVANALDSGCNLFDTAPNYAKTNSERLLGETLRGVRKDVVLVSKFGHKPEGGTDYSPEAFRDSLHGSLERLKTDYLDVVLVHSPPLEVLNGQHPIWAAMKRAQTEGKVRFYGASTDYAFEVRETLETTDAQVLELLFNALHQDVRLVFDQVRDNDVGVITKVPLDSGWLGGKYTAKTLFDGVRMRWSEADIAQRASLVEQLAWLPTAERNLAQQSLAYLLSYDEVSSVIPGIRSQSQLEANLGATGQRLSRADQTRLETFWDGFTDKGTHLLPW